MINFIVYNTAGEIVRTGGCPASQLEYQAGEGETVVENTGGWNDEEHYWDGVQFTTKPPVVKSTLELIEEVQAEIRRMRFQLLTACDWTQTADAPLDELTKAEWAAYRQQLRDLPAMYANETDFANVVWPTKP